MISTSIYGSTSAEEGGEGGEGAGGGGGDHWSGSFQHDSIATPEARESFTKSMSKYGSQEEAIIGGFNAQKQAGKPFKLPESLDKLDDNGRQELSDGISKLYPAMGDADFEGFDFSTGSEEGQPPINDVGKANLKEVIQATGMSKDHAQKVVAQVNKMNREGAQQQKELSDKLSTDCNAKMVAHFGSQAEADAVSKSVMRAFQQRSKSPEEFEATGKAIVQSGLSKHPELAIALARDGSPLW